MRAGRVARWPDTVIVRCPTLPSLLGRARSLSGASVIHTCTVLRAPPTSRRSKESHAGPGYTLRAGSLARPSRREASRRPSRLPHPGGDSRVGYPPACIQTLLHSVHHLLQSIPRRTFILKIGTPRGAGWMALLGHATSATLGAQESRRRTQLSASPPRQVATLNQTPCPPGHGWWRPVAHSRANRGH